jgi:glycosyltransferase involved in cell wall biosynthesis
VKTTITPGIDSKSLSTLTFGLTAALHTLFHKPDVALVMNVANGFWIPLLRLRGIPVLTNVDGIEWERAKWGKLARAVFKVGARLTAWSSNALIFDAAAIAKRWQHDYSRSGTIIAYGGDSVAALPTPPGLTHRGYALVVARFVPENTIAEFLTAAETIAQHYDVVLVGSSGYGGEIDAQVEALAAANPRVHCYGHLSDDNLLHALWQHAGVYFHGHSVGGTNPALVQAMACGSPIVARDTVYNREVLCDAGRFSTAEPKNIATACLEVLANQTTQEQLAAAALARAQSHYTWESVNAAYATALTQQLRKR